MTWAKKSYTFIKNIRWFSTSTAKYFIPMTGSTNENTSGGNSGVNLCPTNSGRLTKIDLVSDVTPGTTILTIEDDVAGTIGTVSFTYNGSGVLTTLNFPEDLDSGTNEFDGVGRISIGLDVAASAGTGQAVATFEIDL